MKVTVYSTSLVFITATGLAQAQSAIPMETDETASGAGQATSEPAQGTTTTTTYVAPWGFPQPGFDPNEGLPSSSRPVRAGQSDTFDLGQGPEPPVVQGGKDGQAILGSERAARAPEIHVVKQGDTLWDLCGRYYENPWSWPKVWSYNPQIQNPHWIYPGDQLRIADPNVSVQTARFAPFESRTLGAGGRSLRASGAPSGQSVSETMFLRDFAYIGDADRDVWGEVIGAVEDQLLLAQGNHIYLSVREGKDVSVGEQLTIFRSQHRPPSVPGARRPPGEVVAVQGTAVVDHYDAKARIARAYIAEATDAIERGARFTGSAARLGRIEKQGNEVDLWATVISSPYPIVYLGQYQLAFIDRGTDDGLAEGNTLLVVRKGDTYRRSLATTSPMAKERVKMTAPEPVLTEETPMRGDERTFPAEAVAELRILRAEKRSAVAIVVQSRHEIVVGDRALARKGY